MKNLTNEELHQRLLEVSISGEDATEIIQEAINRSMILPHGDYVISKTIQLNKEELN